MHVVLVEPRFPTNQRLFVKALAEVGASVTAIGEGSKESLDDDLKRWLRHYEQVVRLLGSLGRLIEEVKPEVVSIENVPRLVTFREGRVFRGFLASLRRTGYDVSWGVLYGPDFGLAQTRSRLVLMA